MQIYVNGHLVKAQILPVDKPTLDETLESFSFALISDTNAMPYAPCQKVQVITDSNEKINLFLVSDSVEIYSVSPTRYKHNITCVQNTRKLSKHLVRNSSFTTPSYIEKKAYSAITCSMGQMITDELLGGKSNYDVDPHCVDNYISESINLRTINHFTTEKIKNVYFKFSCFGQYEELDYYSQGKPMFTFAEFREITDITTAQSQVQESCPYLSFDNNLILNYTDANGTPQGEPLLIETVNGWYPVGQKVKFDRVKELADAGCNNFSVTFSGSLVNGEVSYPAQDPVTPVPYYRFFTFQVEIIAETYYYNCYELLNLLRYRQRKVRHVQGTEIGDDSLFQLRETGDLANLLKSTPAPNFVFTQLTMYECVAEVFRIFDAIFTMDEDGYLGIEYFNEANGRDVSSTLKKVGQNSSSSEDKYTNGLVSYYQNAKTVEEFPVRTSTTDDGVWASIKTKELAVPNSNNSFIFEMPHNINQILEATMNVNFADMYSLIYVKSAIGSYNAGTAVEITKGIDISNFIVEEELWTLLDSGKDLYVNNLYVSSTLKQINTLFFKKGTKEIDASYNYRRYWSGTTQYAILNMINCALLRMFGIKNSNENDIFVETRDFDADNFTWDQLGLRVKYVTEVDGRLKIESIDRKYDGETLVDQYNGAVDLNKMGLNILGLSLKLGNPTLTVTQKIVNWNDRIKQGDIYNYQGKTWIANVVAYTILGNGKVQATIQFVQNFNALAMRTQLLREKRMSNISNELTVKSEENVVDYVYVATTRIYNPTHSPIAVEPDAMKYNLKASLGGGILTNNTTIDMAVIAINNSSPFYYVPMIKYGAGNSICFEVSYEDPMSAGKRTRITSGGWYNTSYFTDIVKYTNDYGEFAEINVYFVAAQQIYVTPMNLPQVDNLYDANIFVDRLEYQKQPNEIFALNYQLTFLPNTSDLDFIGTKFIENNVFVNSSVRTLSDVILYYRKDDFKYSVLDIKGSGQTVAITDVDIVSGSGDVTVLNFSLANTLRNVTSFALCEKDGTILFASNRPLDGDTMILTFYTNHHRIDKKVLEDL